MVDLAVKAQLRIPLMEKGLKDFPEYFTVKAPVFSSSKLKGVDHILGPEMKSTGEVLGIGYHFHEALYKALFPKGNPFKEISKHIFCSIADREKDSALLFVQNLVNKGFSIVATNGTAQYLLEHGLKNVFKLNEISEAKALFHNEKLALL